MKRITALLVFALGATALAQVDPTAPVVFDPRVWFSDVTALAGLVFAVTSLIKGRFKLHDFATLGVSFGSGILISVGFQVAGLFNVTIAQAAAYGIAAATLASGGREGILVILMKAFSWLSPFFPPQPVTGEAAVHEDAEMPPSRKE